MDERLLYFFNLLLASPWLDAVVPILGGAGLALCPSLALALAWGGHPNPDRAGGRTRRVGSALLAALVVGLALVLAMQYLTLRPRPEGVRLVGPVPNFPSFPSGHAMAAWATAAILALAYGRRVGWPAFTLAALVAFSRVYQGHHFPSDVFAGAVLGAGVGAAAYGLIVSAGRGAAARWLLWPQLALVVVISEAAYLNLLPLWLLRWPGADKVLHFTMFGLVAFWLHQWLSARRPGPTWRVALWAVLLPFSAAAIEELLQGLSRYRTMDVLDLACDLAGMLVLAGLSVWVGKRQKKKVRWAAG
jgi:undecaprenyl-diphosphatase